MPAQMPDGPKGRRIRHVAIVCFSVSGIAFVACGLGLLVSHAFTGSLVIAGTAAVGLIYLAMGLMNLGFEPESDDLVAGRNVTDSGEDSSTRVEAIGSSSRDRG